MRSRHPLLPLLLALGLGCAARPPGTTPEAGTPDSGTPFPEAENYVAGSGRWWDGAVFYEIFVRSFQDSNGDGIGDLKGLTSRLDYLNDGDDATTGDLGVDALWLMPIFDSPSYHGYDVVDYERIEPDYGTSADFDLLIAEAHKRGIRVIVDFVANHSSSQHPWFVNSASAPAAERRDWYVWSATNPGWRQPWSNGGTWHLRNGAWYYGLFWGGMPDLNYAHPPVREEMKRLAAHWLSKGVDGFRLDAARYLIETGGGAGQADTPETHAYWREFAAHVRAANADAVLVGENWSEANVIASYYGSTEAVPGGDELNMNFNFPVAGAVVGGVNFGNATPIAAALRQVQALYPKGITDAPFLTNHDMVRVATELQGDARKMRNAASVLLTLPGSPFLYYGEEIGLRNGTTNNDEAKRTPMPWDASAGRGFTTGSPWFAFSPGAETTHVAAQTGDPASLLSHYRTLIRTRKGSPALSDGNLRVLTGGTDPSPLLGFVRFHPDERVLVVHNLGDGTVTSEPLDARGALQPILLDPGVSATASGDAPGSHRVTLGPRETGIWRLQ